MKNEINYLPLNREQAATLEAFASFPSQLLNLSVRIDIDEKVNEELFLKALRAAVTRLPYCSYRLHKAEDGSLCQYRSDEEPIGVDQVVDLSQLSPEKAQKQLDKWAAEPFPRHCRDVQLYRIYLVRLAEDKHCVFVCVHHAIMDVYAIVSTVIYIGKCYNALRYGTELPPEAPDPDATIEIEKEYMKSPSFLKDIEWWEQYYSTSPHFTSINGRGSKEFIEGRNYGLRQTIFQMKGQKISYRIDKAVVEKVNEAAMKNRVAPQLYYYMALRSYLGRVSGTDDVLMSSLVSRRATLLEKKSGLSRARAMFFRTIVPEDKEFTEALREVSNTQKDMYRHATLRTSEVIKIISDRHPFPKNSIYYTVWFTYQPYIDFSELGIPVHITFMDADVAPAPLYLTIMPHDTTGDLYATYQLAVGYTPMESAERFHKFMVKFLENALNSPEKTVGQLIDLSMN